MSGYRTEFGHWPAYLEPYTVRTGPHSDDPRGLEHDDQDPDHATGRPAATAPGKSKSAVVDTATPPKPPAFNSQKLL